MFMRCVARATRPWYNPARTNTIAEFSESRFALAQFKPVPVNITKDQNPFIATGLNKELMVGKQEGV